MIFGAFWCLLIICDSLYKVINSRRQNRLAVTALSLSSAAARGILKLFALAILRFCCFSLIKVIMPPQIHSKSVGK